MKPMASWPVMGSTGEAILFWCVAVFMVASALGVLFFRKAAYNVICMVGVMLGLAILYIAQGAPFLGAVQVIVYTGAIMMLFLFVLMMIGIGASDEYQRQRRGNIIGAVLGGLGLAVILVGVVGHTQVTDSVGLGGEPYSDTVITTLASTLFSDHWFSMELAGALLITSAIGAVLLTRSDRLGPAISQRSTAEAKMRAFAHSGRRIGQLPAPGVYAQSNSVDVPAIAGDTLGPVEESVPRVLRVRGLDRTIGQVEPDVAESLQLVRTGEAVDSPFGPSSSDLVPPSGAWGMPGPGAPEGLDQPVAPTPDEGAAATGDAPEGPGPDAPTDAAQDEPDAGRPGTDHVGGPGTHASGTATEGEGTK